MILTAHQSQFFGGYAGYLSKIDEADAYIYMDNVDFEKNSYVNRNRIRTKDGWMWLTVPVLKPYDKIKDIRIDNSKDWRKKHIKSIEQNYSKAPYFEKYMGPIRSVYYGEDWEYLSDFNLFCLMTVLRELDIETQVVKMSDYVFRGEKSDLILDMCLKFGAKYFIFGAKAVDYVKPVLFSDAGISIEIQDYQCKPYPQVYPNFVPYCSIIDLLMMKGPDSLKVIQSKT